MMLDKDLCNFLFETSFDPLTYISKQLETSEKLWKLTLKNLSVQLSENPENSF